MQFEPLQYVSGVCIFILAFRLVLLSEAEALFRKSVGLETNDMSHHVGLFIAVTGQNNLTDAARVYMEIKRLQTDSALRAM
jgi:hypothetical protein